MWEARLEKLKAALGQNPWDHELRLVYADCLEEHDQVAAAEEQRRAAAKKQRRRARGRAPGIRETYDTTDSSAVYRKLHKRRFAGCDRCPWHGGENAGRRPGHSSWKKAHKQQWRMK
jgi:uncharacterized protein (TIGR02996 family)